MSEEQDRKALAWYVYEGQMCSGTVIAVFTIALENEGPFSDREVMNHFLDGDRSTTHIMDKLVTLSKYKRVALLSGMRIVPVKDLYATKKAAANAFHEKLLAQGEE